MNKFWLNYSEKYLQLSVREQYLILITGLVAAFFITFHVFIDPLLVANTNYENEIKRLTKSNHTLKSSMVEVEIALANDLNEETRTKIAQFQAKLTKVDAKLLTLTSELINPIQMRYALIDLLDLKKGVSLIAFEQLGAEPLLSLKAPEKSADDLVLPSAQAPKTELNLYRHGMKVKLSGSYFQLQAYLAQLEQLSWKFFWQDFNFTSKEYPASEVEIIIYSLSTKKEFVGV